MKSSDRIHNLFVRHKAYIAYLTAGDGGIEKTLAAALALIEGGVNLLEIGVPFSDPVADGPVIQQAAQRALQQGTTLKDILCLIRDIRKHSDIPIILFSYLNPILSVMQNNFFAQCAEVGVDGLLLVDCPLEESHEIEKECLHYDLAPIYVISPTTSLQRIQTMNQRGRGFLYYACRNGTTGVRSGLPEDFVKKVRQIKANSDLPLVVGFGISDRTMAEQVLSEADGVVVGSYFVKALAEGKQPHELTTLAKNIFPQERLL